MDQTAEKTRDSKESLRSLHSVSSDLSAGSATLIQQMEKAVRKLDLAEMARPI